MLGESGSERVRQRRKVFGFGLALCSTASHTNSIPRWLSSAWIADGRPLNGLSRVEANGVDALESKWIAMLQNKVGRLGRAGLLITLLIPTTQLDAAQAEPPLTLSETAPEHYTVQAGDTVWDIASLFLREPWRWQELWAGNEHLDDAHVIESGDELSVVWDEGRPTLTATERGDVTLSPSVRRGPLHAAIPAIPQAQIAPFLRQHRVVESAALAQTPFVVATDANRLLSSVGDTLYSRVIGVSTGSYHLVRHEATLIDPLTEEDLGIFMTDIGRASVNSLLSSEGLSALVVTQARQEIRLGDRLLGVEEVMAQAAYHPQAPAVMIENALIIGAASGMAQIGALDIVVINRGARESVHEGDVLMIQQRPPPAEDSLTAQSVVLPDRRAGVLMVFAVFDRASFGLVLEASRPLAVGDALRSP